MSQFKNNKTGYWAIKVVNPRTHKQTTIRRNPYTNLPFKTKKEAKLFEADYIKNTIDVNMKFEDLFEKYHQYFLIKNPIDYDLMSWYKNQLYKLGNKKISSIRTSDLEHLAKDMLNNGYSINYINKQTSVVKTVLNYGVSHGYLSRNLCATYKPLRKITTSESLRYWTPEQFKKAVESIPFAFNAKNTDIIYIRQLLLFAYYTGMRNGEIRALKWKDIDLDKNILFINRHIAAKVNIKM